MSLADLIPAILSTRKEPRRFDAAEWRREWRKKNREHLRLYKRQWRANGGRT